MRKVIIAFVAAIASLALVVPMAGAITGSVMVNVSCAGEPEKTTITNETDTTLDLSQMSLGSIYAPRSNEPFRLSGTLASGQSRVFESGQGASGNVLTHQDIFNNEHLAQEGARLHTAFGDLTVMCDTGSGSIVAQSGSPLMAGGAGLPKTGTGGYLSADRADMVSFVVLASLTLVGSALAFGGLRARHARR